ncbi:hypothetical protein Aros01_04632 [Streptosporangium roseum]
MSNRVTYTAVLDVQRETVEFLSDLLAGHRANLGTRAGTRALGPFNQAVLVLRWFLDGTRVRQLAADNAIGKSTAYDYLHEGIDVMAAQAPDLATAPAEAQRDGAGHLNLDGTVLRTDRVAPPPARTAPTCGGNPWRIGAIVKAAHVLLRLEDGRHT